MYNTIIFYEKKTHTQLAIDSYGKNVLEFAKSNIEERFDTEEYSDAIFVINSCDLINNISYLCDYCKENFPWVKRVIYYDCEQFYIHKKYVLFLFIENLKTVPTFLKERGFDFEIWSYNPINLKYYDKLFDKEIKYKFVPCVYSNTLQEKYDILKKSRLCREQYQFKFGFIGEIFNYTSAYRLDNLKKIYTLDSGNDFPFLLIERSSDFLNNNELNSMYESCLNIHQYDENSYQEVLRIAPMIQSGIPVITEKSNINFFGDLVLEYDFDNFEYSDFKDKVFNYLENFNDNTERYKEMTINNYNEYLFDINKQLQNVTEQGIYNIDDFDV